MSRVWHLNHHYITLGGLFTACGRRRLEVFRSTDEIDRVKCRWCLTSEEYLAARMEAALDQPKPLPANILITNRMAWNDITKKEPST